MAHAQDGFFKVMVIRKMGAAEAAVKGLELGKDLARSQRRMLELPVNTMPPLAGGLAVGLGERVPRRTVWGQVRRFVFG